MTIANENNRVDLVAASGQTIFTYNFKINAADEIAVYLTADGSTPDDATDILILTTDYSLSGVGADAGGTITLTVAATLDDSIVMVRSIDFIQDNEFVIGQDHAENIEAALDSHAMRIQRLAEGVNRAVSSSGISDGRGYTLPYPAPGEVLMWNTAGDALINLAAASFDPLAISYTVATKAQAVLLTPATDKTLYILSDDGNGNIWQAVTGAAPGTYSDDGGAFCGTMFIPTGGDGSSAWVRNYDGGAYRPEWFGVFGKGLVDETVNMQALLTEIPDNSIINTSGLVILLDGSLQLLSKTNVNFIGNGTFKNFGTWAGFQAFLNLKLCNACSVSGLTIIGPRTFPQSAGFLFDYYGIAMSDCNDIEITGCRFEKIDVAVKTSAIGFDALALDESYNGTEGNFNIRITNNHYQDIITQCNFLGFGYGSDMLLAHNTANNIVSFCKVDGQHIKSGSTVYTTRTAPRTNNIIIVNNIIKNVNEGIVASSYGAVIQVEEFVENIHVLYNRITNVTCANITGSLPYIRYNNGQFDEGVKNCTLIGNTFRGNETPTAIHISVAVDGNLDTENIIIQDNIIEIKEVNAVAHTGILLGTTGTGTTLIKNVLIKNNHIDMDGHTVVGRAVSLSNTGANTNITGLIIDDNKCWDAAIFLDKAVDLTIKDNDVNLPTSTSSMAISINNVNGGVIKNNTVIGGDRGIRSINSNNIDISYNTVKDTDNVGIYLQTGTGDDISITSNHISNVCVNLGTDCILVDDAITYTADFNTLHGSTNAIYGLRNATAGGNPSSFNNNMFSNLTADIRVNTTNLSWSMQYGSNVLWVDSTGDLRIKAGNPTSDTDGTIVGTQS